MRDPQPGRFPSNGGRTRKSFWNHQGLFLVTLFLVTLFQAWGQSPSQKKMLEAVRSGKVKVTPEMIQAQKALHPELRNLSDQEIEAYLHPEKGMSESDTTWGDDEDAENLGMNPSQKNSLKNKAFKDGRNSHSSGRDSLSDTASVGRFPAGLRRFGYEFFENAQGNSSLSQLPSLPEYVLSPGDEIQVYTWGRENQNQSLTIDAEGMFHYPPLQPMRLGSMRFSEAERLLKSEIEKIHGVKASITLGRLRSIRVFVLGEVNNPGSYVVPAGATVTSALFRSGGIQEIGSLRGIQLRRNRGTIATLDLYDMLLSGNNKADRQLVTGDVIFVPVAEIQIAVTGNVKRPAIYEVKSGTKVLQALDLAGGLQSNAFRGRLRLDRIESHSRKVVLDISMEKLAGKSNPSLADGDILFVDKVLEKEFDVVYLKGNVNRPGRYEYKEGMSAKDLIPSQKELKSETYFKYGHIKRSSEMDERALLIPFSLTDVLSGSATVPLMARDTVIIYSRYDLMDQPLVKAQGLVRNPGEYSFVDQMRISDLVLASGGLTIEAYLPEAHLIRVLKAGESDSLHSTLIKVNLTGVVDNPGDESNVELRPFDSLVVFPRSNFILPKSVSIFGAINNPGKYELTGNMGIPELVSQASGLTRNAFSSQVEVVRKHLVSDSLVQREVIRLSLRDLLDGKVQFNLMDADGVYVREVVNSRESSRVFMTGEFAFPGIYEFQSGETLSEVIQRAGGFAPNAYLRGAVFIRKSVKNQQLQHVEEIARRLENQMQILFEQTVDEKERAAVQAAIQQRKGILEDIKEAPYLGRVVVKLDKGMKFSQGDYDITLEDGDSLWIGPQPHTISVMGEVYSPTNLIFSKDNNSIGECLAKAGGVNQYGDWSNTYYVLPDGSVETPRNTSWFVRYNWKNVEPGGSIIVPPKGPKKDYLELILKTTQVIYNLAVSVGVVRTLF
jgi:polysaccharide export outer membrane protein